MSCAICTKTSYFRTIYSQIKKMFGLLLDLCMSKIAIHLSKPSLNENDYQLDGYK